MYFFPIKVFLFFNAAKVMFFGKLPPIKIEVFYHCNSYSTFYPQICSLPKVKMQYTGKNQSMSPV
jgi:hypothetical protein